MLEDPIGMSEQSSTGSLKRPGRIAVISGTAPGIGGLGHSVSAGITGCAKAARDVFAFGPAGPAAQSWSLPGLAPRVNWSTWPNSVQPWMVNYTWLRWRQGEAVLMHDRRIGRWAAAEVKRVRPHCCYLFTQVALETLQWCKKEGIPTILDNPNGHIRNFQQICETESRRWCGTKFRGHPTNAMSDRVEAEYELADHIRVYSEWGKASMMRYGVPEEKIQVLGQTVNLDRFCPPSTPPAQDGALRVCYVGSLDLRKGFVYLLRAVRAIGAKRIRLRIVGATGDRHCAALLEREREGLAVEIAPGNALPVYQESEVLVIPTLEDGLPFVLVEGLACGLPTIVTNQAGASECVRHGESGWVIPPGDVHALASALEDALKRRAELAAMGQRARAAVENYAGMTQLRLLSHWISECMLGQSLADRKPTDPARLHGLSENTHVSQ